MRDTLYNITRCLKENALVKAERKQAHLVVLEVVIQRILQLAQLLLLLFLFLFLFLG